MNFYMKILFVVSVSATLNLEYVLPSTMNNVIISSSGTISFISELHVDGNQIKDANGNIIHLRGSGIYQYAMDPTGWWWPEGGAWYQGRGVWNENAVRYHLRQMKSWGMNAVRFHTSAEWWIQDNVDLSVIGLSGSTSYRHNSKRTAEIAAEEGLYVIYDLFGIKNGYWHLTNDYTFVHIPFTPYLHYSEEITLFPNGKQSFVDFWVSMANEFKNYPNAIFELFNEPNVWNNEFPMPQARNDWFDAMQQAITAIRQAGATNLIIAEWGLGTAPGTTWEHPFAPSLDWIEHANLTDPTGNLAYAGHMYRTYLNPTWYDAYNYTNAYTKMQQCKFDYAVGTLNKPVIITEIGVNMWENNSTILSSGLTALGQELQWARNVFNISNQWGIGYTAWDWTITDQWHLISLNGLPTPSAWGQVLIDSIKAG